MPKEKRLIWGRMGLALRQRHAVETAKALASVLANAASQQAAAAHRKSIIEKAQVIGKHNRRFKRR